MKNIGIISNTDRDPGLCFAREIMSFLEERGCNLTVARQETPEAGRPQLDIEQEIYTQSDFLIVLGGDGTILRVARDAALHATPVLGINLGNLGYLTDVERNGAFHALTMALTGQYKLEKRMMLEACLVRSESSGTEYLALNDVCILRGHLATMLDMELRINNEYIDTYRADGLIVATPTGSTAYNLSAGGPILKPDVEMIAITPICAHLIFTRSFVISASDSVEIKIEGHYDGFLAIDGQNRIPVQKGDVIRIRRSTYYTTIMKTNTLGFYDILRQKMQK